MRIWLVALTCAVLLSAQSNPDDQRKHLAVPIENSTQPWSVSASEIERGADYPSVIHLKGEVEVRMPICVNTRTGPAQHCAGEVVLHADEVDLHEQTGQFEARGAVKVMRR